MTRSPACCSLQPLDFVQDSKQMIEWIRALQQGRPILQQAGGGQGGGAGYGGPPVSALQFHPVLVCHVASSCCGVGVAALLWLPLHASHCAASTGCGLLVAQTLNRYSFLFVMCCGQELWLPSCEVPCSYIACVGTVCWPLVLWP